MARALDRYLRCFLGDRLESYFMTYRQCFLSGDLFRQVDLFVLELFKQDAMSCRAEAIPVAEKWASSGKKVLIVSGAAEAARIGMPFYWDLGASDSLRDRIAMLLDSPVPGPEGYNRLKRVFQYYCLPPVSRHHSSRISRLTGDTFTMF